MKYGRNESSPASGGGDKKQRKVVPIWKPAVLLGSSVVAVVIYRVAANYMLTWMFWVYFAALLVVSLVYVFYNRGFSRWSIKPDMLPQNWSDEEKAKFFDDSNRWKRQSAWMLYVAFPLVVTFVVDYILIIWEEFTFRG